MKKVALSLTLVFALTQVFGQLTTNKTKLNSLSTEKAIEFKAKKNEAIDYAKRHNIPVLINEENVLMELMYIDELGQPQYYSTYNVNAAATVSTNKVNSGGGFGYSLDGSGMTIHEWDGGGVLTTHQEYNGRVVQADNVTTTHYHSTHVAGTMIGSGVVANAKGMASAASLRAFDWNSDESEMAAEASNGALISNHSYGFNRGWEYDGSWSWFGNTSISTLEDYLFGFYDSQAQSWDNIAYNAPYYLIVRSAGNDRNAGPGSGTYPDDGPYDCISHSGVSKNVLTVGSVLDIAGGYTQASDVVMSSYSSWGPVDDGRIKPDIVANGSSLYSSDNGSDNSYLTLSGTSMASPNAAGSMLLLQEHYEDIYGSNNYMRASTLKAVVIHTADETGIAPGPDYEFGWGLLNTKAAADLISDDILINTIEENTLANAGSYTRTVKALGTEPLKVTVVWTDVPGSPVTASLDPTDQMLVNDLDLRVNESTNIFYPWKLDGTNPANAATRAGENNIDNVEVVVIDNPIAGVDYTIVVDHDGMLSGGAQAFSLVVSGIEDPGVPPVADFIVNNTAVSTGSMITFSDQSTNNPAAWTWSFSPATVTFVNGTDANSRNPQLTFDVAGTYDVTLVADNSYGSDTETKTAYISATVPQPVTLPWVEDFEGFSGMMAYTSNTQFIDGLPKWSFEKTVAGRLRFNVGTEYCFSGNCAATLDAATSNSLSINYFTATLDLSDYASSTDLALSFMYMQHGEDQQDNDKVWVRGNNSEPWIEAFDLYQNQAAAGTWKSVMLIDIDDILASNGQVPGNTFQLRFGQEDESPTITTAGNDGYTFDDITIQEATSSAYVINSFPYTQSWESGEGLWMQSTEDDFDWIMKSGTTPSGTTGPSGAHDGSYYLYTESSSPRIDGEEAWIEATFDLTLLPNPELTFFHHMYGSTMGSLHVDVYNGTSWTNDVWLASGQLQTAESDPYQLAVVNLTTWGGMDNIIVRFRGTVGDGLGGSIFYSDMAFDMVAVDDASSIVLPVADFSANNTAIAEGDIIQFTDLSTDGASWSWTFNGGTPATSNMQNPSVTYNTPGVYTVELTVSNADGSDTETKVDYINVVEVLYPPVADFSANTTAIEEGESVQFNDQSSNNPTNWSWTFEGAGTPNSTAQNPVVSYTLAGTYSVTLVASNGDGSDSEIKTGYILVNPALTEHELCFSDFENGFGIWTDGGNDCMLHTAGTYAWGGNQAANIQDKSGIASSFYLTDGIDVHTPGYVQIDVEFYFVALGMKNSKDQFMVEYFDGSSWNAVAIFSCKTDFTVGNYYKAIVSISESDYNFPADMKIRFMSLAKKDTKDVFIDDIKIIGSTQTMQTNAGLTLMMKSLPYTAMVDDTEEDFDIELYPNPVVNSINIDPTQDGEMTVFIYNATGQQMYYGERLENNQVINVSNFDNGLYVVKVLRGQEMITKRFLKQ